MRQSRPVSKHVSLGHSPVSSLLLALQSRLLCLQGSDLSLELVYPVLLSLNSHVKLGNRLVLDCIPLLVHAPQLALQALDLLRGSVLLALLEHADRGVRDESRHWKVAGLGSGEDNPLQVSSERSDLGLGILLNQAHVLSRQLASKTLSLHVILSHLSLVVSQDLLDLVTVIRGGAEGVRQLLHEYNNSINKLLGIGHRGLVLTTLSSISQWGSSVVQGRLSVYERMNG
mmetsp:Transcript_190/g.345  ORF Transcript_190/g.345 Transcript_190/m.345 type:complete len:229 (-) Transcript_190:1057-1743(-)